MKARYTPHIQRNYEESKRATAHRFAGFRVAQVFLLVPLAGCFSSPTHQDYYYYLAAPTAVPKVAKGARLALGDFTAASGYESDRIAYRTQDNELQYYGYRRWVSEPAKMIEEIVQRHLRASKRFLLVDSDQKVNEPDGILEGHIDAIEEVDHEDRVSARLAISFVLRGPDAQQVLLRYGFDQTRPCKQRHPRHIAHAVGEMLKNQARILADRVAHRLNGR